MLRHDPASVAFASDNYAGVHPEVMAALTEANGGDLVAYGEDPYTAALQESLSQTLKAPVEVYPTFNGTGANVVALQAMLPRWGAVIAAESAHINTDEGGAPERMGGVKILTVPTPDGKLTPELVDRQAWGWGFEHRAQPLVVSISQTTELGTCYTPGEIRALAEHAHARGMRLHVDGARLANAAAYLGTDLAAISSGAGVDVLSLGGTKNGAMGAEAVVVLDAEAAPGMTYVRKLSMQLASKMRFVSAQLLALYDGDLWLRNAAHANAMAARLRAHLVTAIDQGEAPGLSFTQDTQANALFAILPPAAAATVRERYRFYDWDEATGEVRWMCSFQTTTEQVDAMAREVIAALAAE